MQETLFTSQPSAIKKLFLMDAMALIYRAHFVFVNNPRVTSAGVNTSAAFGFTNTLLDILQKEHPTHIGVAFESKAPTFRHTSYEQYKANRQAPPEELIQAIPMVQRILEAFCIPVLSAETFEADDVIGTLALQAASKGFEVYLMTPDKDFAQLVQDRIYLYRPGLMGKPREILDAAGVKERYGVPPHLIADLLGLKGDASDNIPGIPKVGDKTALQLLEEFGSLENVLANADKVSKAGVRQALQEHAELARFSKELATIHTSVPLELDEEGLKICPPNRPALEAVFMELEFRTLGRRVFGDGAPAVLQAAQAQLALGPEAEPVLPPTSYRTLDQVPHNYQLLYTEHGRKELINKLLQQKAFCFDTETTSLDTLLAELLGISFSWQPGEAYYVVFPADEAEARQVLQEFKPVFENTTQLKIAHNLKYDLGILSNYGLKPQSPYFDTMLAHYVVKGDGKHNMDFLARALLDYEPIPLERLIGKKGKGQLPLRQVPIEKMGEYSCEDADITFQLYQKIAPDLDAFEVRSLLETIELPLVPVLLAMETEGIAIDAPFLADYSLQLDKELQLLESEIHRISGEVFNINSPKQLAEILFEKLKLGGKAKLTATGQFATDEQTLSYLAAEHELPAQVLEFRQLNKLKSTYVDTLPELISPRTGRVHTSFNQTVAITGRLSSNNPNLQNIPIRTDRGREVRKAFLPRNANHVLLSADYSQIELRLMAHLADEAAMKSAFVRGEDIHRDTASRIFGVPAEGVTADMRRKAKMANFGIIYGISAFGLASRLRIDRQEAKQIITAYFDQYPGVQRFMKESMDFARREGYVRTVGGRRHYLPNIRSANATVRAIAERNAINTPIQGSAADMIKLAMIGIHAALEQQNLQAKMLVQVHDELLFDVPKTELEQVKRLVQQQMVQALPLTVPVEVNLGVGDNWLDAH